MANVDNQIVVPSNAQLIVYFKHKNTIERSEPLKGPMTLRDVVEAGFNFDNTTKLVVKYNGGLSKNITEDAAWRYFQDQYLNDALDFDRLYPSFLTFSDAYETFKGINDQETWSDFDYGTYQQQNRLTYRDVA